MTSQKWMIFVFFLFIFATIFSNLLESSMIGDDGLTPMGECLQGIPFVEIETDAGPIYGTQMLSSFFTGIGRILAWDYSFFEGTLYGFPLVLFQMFGLALSTVMIFDLAIMFINALRGILPY